MGIKRKTAGPQAYSDTRLRILDDCLRKYFYAYIDHNKDYDIIPVNMFKGLFFHKMFELSWIYDKEIGGLRQRFKSRDTYIKYCTNYFYQFLSDGHIRGTKVDWKSKKDMMRFISKWGEGKEILSLFYEISKGEGPPLAVEVPFKMRINKNELLVGVIDEIRKKKDNVGLKIRDHKYYFGGLSQEHLDFDHQFTLYLLNLTADLQNNGPISQNYLKFERQKAIEISGDTFLSKNISLEYQMVKQDLKIISVERNFESLDNFTAKFSNNKRKLNQALHTGDFTPNFGERCSYCLHKVRCDKDHLEKKVQGDLFKIPIREYREEEKEFKISSVEALPIDPHFVKRKRDKTQKSIRFKKV